MYTVLDCGASVVSCLARPGSKFRSRIRDTTVTASAHKSVT